MPPRKASASADVADGLLAVNRGPAPPPEARPDGPLIPSLPRALNASHVDPLLPPASLGQIARHYLCSVVLYGLLLAFLAFNPYFKDLLSIRVGTVRALDVYLRLYAAYVLLAPVAFLIFRPRSLWISKNLAIAGYCARVFRRCCGSRRATPESLTPSYLEKHALAFLVIKLFYGPLMLNSAFIEYQSIPGLVTFLRGGPPLLDLLDMCYLLFVSGVFLVDSVLFFIGYHTEGGWLHNRLRYAETNVFRILVCIACYAPFNQVTGTLFGPSNHEPRILFHGDLAHPLTWILRAFAVGALLLMTTASLSLFTRASNLTNRGIVTWGPYRYIRHPGYLGKNLFWLATLAPLLWPHPDAPGFTWLRHALLCAAVLWGILGWGTLYFLRSITEEQFLSRDPDYVRYCQKVRYRFIPGVY